MALAPGTKLGPYEIQSPLGAGGMGEVYRANDTKLGRDVALKVLPAEMAHDPERLARFRREAKSLAQLDHPNIVTIYSVEECDGVHFLTMQLVEGQPLDRLIPAGGLPVEQIVEIASALGDALAAAHEKGIVHRDLKPANVMVSNEGRVKVLDFGLAKDVRGANLGDATLTSSQTQVGVVMGTPAYMSPEQTSGRPLDHRTDIFSLGVVLHEMATGQRPFNGESSAELVSAILRDTPPSVTDVRPDLPSDLARIIRRCLEKDPRHRVQTARDVSNEFRDLARHTSQKMTTATPQAPRAVAASDSGAARADEGFWVAVLPFRYGGGNADLTALAEGLTDDIVTGMLRFSYLRVIARGSTAKYSSESGDVRAIGKELGARYVMEGNLRQAGTKLRLAVQLVDAVSGTHLWAENYERTFSPENIFAVQDDLVPRIVSTVADWYGILPHNICDALRRKADDQLSPHEAVLRAFSYFERIAAPEEHAQVRQILERAVRSAPDQGEIWAMLSTVYWHEYALGFNPQPDPLGRALAAARRSVDAAPTNNLGYSALASTFFLQKNILAFRPAAERAIELNRMDGSNLAMMGILMAYSGDWEHGCALVESALQLNPHHPGWYWFAHFLNAYRKGDYRGALSVGLKFNMPGYFYTHALTAAVYGQLGLREPAQKELQELLAIRPDFAVSARKEFEKLYDPELVEHMIDGLRKAGLEIGGTAGNSVTAKASDSGPVGAEERSSSTGGISAIKRHALALAIAVSLLVVAAAGVAAYLKTSKTGQIDSIAVLPLENRSNDPDADYIPDGITESINNSLARVPTLTVIPHSVASHYKGKAMDVRKVGDELHVQAVLTGSVAQRGDNLTVEVELDDVRNGKQLWGEQYKRKLADLLAVQNEIAREVSQRLRSQLSAENQQELTKGSTDSPEAYRLYLKGKYYTDKFTKEGFDTGIDYFNQAIAVDPNYGLAYSGLAYNYINQIDWFMPPNEGGPKTKDAAEKALAIDESDARAHLTLAIETHWYEWKWAAAEAEFKRALELSPNNSEAHLYHAWFLSPMGRSDQALAEAKRAQQADPLSPFASFSLGAVLVFARQWDPAIEQLHRAIELDPTFWFSHCFLGRAYEQKGKLPEAVAEFQRALEVEKDNSEIWSGLGHAYAVSGKRAEAQKVMDHLTELSAHGWVAPYNVAVIYAGLGEKDQAFALLDRAYKDRSYYMATYLATDERLDNLRSDPRFAELRKRVGLPE
ncbi:MAG: protein kinase [Candidatus Sulfotelmatobacter sp.]|jgi:TolB-like protein/Tfp pilus assembly protein PilF